MSSIFGWDYPPGCSSVPGDEPCFCEVCGRSVDNDECICPECPICREQGNPKCYDEHGLVRTEDQVKSLRDVEKEQRKADEWLEPIEEGEPS